MFRRKILSIFLILVSLMAVFSCNNGEAASSVSTGTAQSSPDRIAEVSMVLLYPDEIQKSISTSVQNNPTGNISYFKYTAIPAWSGSQYGTVSGTQTEPADFTNGMLRKFAPGYWRITVIGYDEEDNAVFSWQISCCINPSTSEVIITYHAGQGNGYLHFDVDIPIISEQSTVTLKYGKYGDTPSEFTSFDTGDNQYGTTKKYTATIELPVGFYILQLVFSDPIINYSYGETIVAEVISNNVNDISGNFNFGIMVPYDTDIITQAASGGYDVFFCPSIPDSNSLIPYIWCVNSKVIKSGNSKIFVREQTGGPYTVTCRASMPIPDGTGSEYSEILVDPDTGESTGLDSLHSDLSTVDDSVRTYADLSAVVALGHGLLGITARELCEILDTDVKDLSGGNADIPLMDIHVEPQGNHVNVETVLEASSYAIQTLQQLGFAGEIKNNGRVTTRIFFSDFFNQVYGHGNGASEFRFQILIGYAQYYPEDAGLNVLDRRIKKLYMWLRTEFPEQVPPEWNEAVDGQWYSGWGHGDTTKPVKTGSEEGYDERIPESFRYYPGDDSKCLYVEINE